MQLVTTKRTIDVEFPRLTLRNEDKLRRWYNRLQEIAREQVLGEELLARLVAEAHKRDYDLTHYITPNGTLTQEAQQLDAQELYDVILDCISDDIDLIKLLINVNRYPRTRHAFEVAIEFLKDVCGVTFDEDELQDLPFDDVASVVEEFFRRLQ